MGTRKHTRGSHVYLLHFDPKLHAAGHYCGHTPRSVAERVDMHRRGTGACITRAAAQAGCTLTVARTWRLDTTHDARLLERTLKDTHKLSQFCPICAKAAKRHVSATPRIA